MYTTSHSVNFALIYYLFLVLILQTFLAMAALWNRAGHYIFAPWFLLLSSSSFLPRLISAVADWMSTINFHTWCGLSANLRCRSETCGTRLAANTGRKKVAKNRRLGTIAQLCRAISSQLRHLSTIGKNLLSSNMSSRCLPNMVNFGLLAAEIISLVWGTPANFNGFRVLAALLHGTPAVASAKLCGV